MNRPITLLYPRPWGEAMRCAHLMAGRLAREGHHVLAVDVGRYLASHLLADQVVLICLEGGGERQPEAVLDFLDYVQALEPGDLYGLCYSVFSLGDGPKPNSGGQELDFLLKHLGGTRIVTHIRCPADFAEGFAIWSDAVSDILAFDRALRLSPIPMEL